MQLITSVPKCYELHRERVYADISRILLLNSLMLEYAPTFNSRSPPCQRECHIPCSLAERSRFYGFEPEDDFAFYVTIEEDLVVLSKSQLEQNFQLI